MARKEEKSSAGSGSTSASASTASASSSGSTVSPVNVPSDAIVASTPAKSTSVKTSTKQPADSSNSKSQPQSSAAGKKSNGGNNLSYPERKEMNKLEKEIEKLGGQISEYEDKLARCKEGYTVLAELTNEMNKLVLSLGSTVCVVSA